MFLLNEKILAEQPKSSQELDSWWQERVEQSQAALNTATKMMVDIIDTESQPSPPEAWPPSRLYRLRASLRHLERQSHLHKDDWYDDAEARLRVALDKLCSFWSVKR